MAKVMAYDLGTGGIKASLYDECCDTPVNLFIEYDTFYPEDKRHEQRPMDWWSSVCKSTRILLDSSRTRPEEIKCLAVSGHSLVAVPMDRNGRLLTDRVPIWSDTRATGILDEFFSKVPYEHWYMTTGNGDPAECYSIIKLMWLRRHMPDIFERTEVVLGSKDFVNYMFTGEKCTDPSYASGFGIFDLGGWRYSDEFIKASGLPAGIFPEIRRSDEIIGKVTASAAEASGLKEGTPVACGGVDNSCMALGARGVGEGRVYTSLGSSSWIAVTSRKPVVDINTRPFVFAHIQEGFYTSAMSIFSAGNSFRWLREQLCRDIPKNIDPYMQMDQWASSIPAGSNGVMFNPSLAGGSPQDKSPNIRGSFMGISLGSTREDMVRAVLEGIALSLRISLDGLKKHVDTGDEILFCGGGSKSRVWRQIFSDVFNMKILKTNIDQNAASLGAAAIAARACGLWDSYEIIDSLHKAESTEYPNMENNQKYESLLEVFKDLSDALADAGDRMQLLHSKNIW